MKKIQLLFFMFLINFTFAIDYSNWQTNIDVTLPGEQGFFPKIAINEANGRIICVYGSNLENSSFRNKTNPFDLKVAYSDDFGKTWIHKAEPIARGIGSDQLKQFYVSVVKNICIVVYGNSPYVYCTCSLDGGVSWKNPNMIFSEESFYEGSSVDMIVDETNGNVLAAWDSHSRDRGGLLVTKGIVTPKGVVWSPTQRLTQMEQYSILPRIANNEGLDESLVVFLNPFMPGNDASAPLMASIPFSLQTNINWQIDTDVLYNGFRNGSASSSFGLTYLALDRKGFCNYRKSPSALLIKYTLDGGLTWEDSLGSPIENINLDFFDWSTSNKRNNNSVLFYCENIDSKWVLFSSTSTDIGATWIKNSQINSIGESVIMTDVNSVAYNDNTNDLIVLWEGVVGSSHLIKESYSSNNGQTWSTPVTLSLPNATNQRVAISSSFGNAIAVWEEGIAPNTVIKAAVSKD